MKMLWTTWRCERPRWLARWVGLEGAGAWLLSDKYQSGSGRRRAASSGRRKPLKRLTTVTTQIQIRCCP